MFYKRARGRAVRRKPGEMNGTERRYLEEVLENDQRAGRIAQIQFETITLKLAPDTRYTPDFFVLTADGLIEFHESKGHMEDDAWVKLKVAAAQHPWFRFVLAKVKRKKDGGGWDIKDVA